MHRKIQYLSKQKALFRNKTRLILQTKHNSILHFLSEWMIAKSSFNKIASSKNQKKTFFNYQIIFDTVGCAYVFLFLISIFFCLHLENARKGIPAGKSPIDHLPSNIKPDCCCIHQSSADGRGCKSKGAPQSKYPVLQ